MEDVTVIVKEGETLKDIEDKLVVSGVLNRGDLFKFPGRSLEGFLFPDTYRFFRHSQPEEVVRKILSNFYKKAVPVLVENERLEMSPSAGGERLELNY